MRGMGPSLTVVVTKHAGDGNALPLGRMGKGGETQSDRAGRRVGGSDMRDPLTPCKGER